jgi:hypothetical protein
VISGTKAGLCQCNRWPTYFPSPCQYLITQEDLLCDECRGGWCMLYKVGPGGRTYDDTGTWYHLGPRSAFRLR